MTRRTLRYSTVILVLFVAVLFGCDEEGADPGVDAPTMTMATDGRVADVADTNRDTDALGCYSAGCGRAPICGQACQAACGCCGCTPGEIATLNGGTYRCEGSCYSPVDAGAGDTPADSAGDTPADSAGDSPVDSAACPPCASDEVCVQSNDSSTQCRSPTPTLGCRKLSSACRAELPLISRTTRSCAAVSIACQAELCGSPYQCTYTPPCGNETAAAQVWCYGP